MSQTRVQPIDLRVEIAEVVKPTDSSKAEREKPKQAGGPPPQVKAVQTDVSEKNQEDPSDGVIVAAWSETVVRVCHHRRDEKGINHPTDSQESACDQPDEAGDGATEVEAVHPGKPENPSDVRDEFAVGWGAHGWDWSRKGQSRFLRMTTM